MDGVGVGGVRGGKYPLTQQVGFARRRWPDVDGLVRQSYVQRAAIRIRVDRHRGHAHAPRRADDAAGNFTAVGDQNLVKHTLFPHSHPEHAKGRFLNRRIQRR